MSREIDIGDMALMTGEFSRKGKALYPKDVYCTLEDPAGEVSQPVVELVDDEEGKRYEARVAPTVPGWWQGRMRGTDDDGEPVAATPFRFYVREPNVPLDD